MKVAKDTWEGNQEDGPEVEFAEDPMYLTDMLENLEKNKPKNPSSAYKKKLKYYQDKLKAITK